MFGQRYVPSPHHLPPHRRSNPEPPAPEASALTTALPRSTESAQTHELIWDFVSMYSTTACFRCVTQYHGKRGLIAHEKSRVQQPGGLIRVLAFR